MCRQHRDCGLKKSEGCGSLGLEIVGTSILGLWTVLEGPPWEMGARALSQGPCFEEEAVAEKMVEISGEARREAVATMA